MGDIDFVLPWVDSTDPEWLAARKRYSGEDTGFMNRNEARYRDLGLLRYWFRSVERYAPWVRKIHFVTCGHYPEWLNLNHPKIQLVKHEDYIPQEYLPTFSSNPIELNLHRISGLSEKFVFFNDDIFVTAPVRPSDFFKGNLPRDVAIRTIPELGDSGCLCMREINIINSAFNFWTSFRKNIRKWINYRYGIYNLRTLWLIPHRDFTGVKNLHIANAFRKSTFEDVWEKCPEELDETCRHRFRNQYDINQWLMKYWQLASGDFYPQYYGIGKNYFLYETARIASSIHAKRYKLICFRDPEWMKDFDRVKESVIDIFQKEFPERSSFEYDG